MFEKIKVWTEMSPGQRLTFLTGTIIVVLSIVIIHYENKTKSLNEHYTNVINNINSRCAIDKARMEAKLETCNQNYLLYLQESERDYRELLFEFKRIKEKIKTNEDDI